jgi:mono/diheme cytochrome c family protein
MQKIFSFGLRMSVFVILSMLFICSVEIHAQKFTPAPAWADTLKNPIKNSIAAASSGKKIYVQYCVTCHGEKGKGDGVSVAGLPKHPTDHTSEAFQKQSDGAIFWESGNGTSPMPMFKNTLKPIQLWQLVEYIRTLPNASKK